MAKSTWITIDKSDTIADVKLGSKKLLAKNVYELYAVMASMPDTYRMYIGNYGGTVTYLKQQNEDGYHPTLQLGYANSIEFIFTKYVDDKFQKSPDNVKFVYKDIKLSAKNIGMDKKGRLVRVIDPNEPAEVKPKAKKVTGYDNIAV